MSIHKLILAFLFVGCSSNFESRKLLRLVDVTGSINQNSQINSDWDLTESRSINFSACVIDQGRESVVKGQTFKILKPDQSEVVQTKVIESDGQGCVYWSESFGLDPLAQPSYITTDRILQATNFYHPISLHMGINLWSGLNGKEAVVENLEKGLNLLSKDRTVSTEKSLLINKAQLNLNLENSVPKIQISFYPFVNLNKMDGKQNTVAVMRGILKLKPQIIAIKSDGSQTAFSNEVGWTAPIRFNNNFVSSGSIPLQFGQLSNDVTYYLSLQIEPLSGPPNLKGQMFLLKIGDRNQLFKTKDLVTDTELKSAAGFTPSASAKQAGFDLDLIHANFAGVTKDENQAYSTIKLNLYTKVFIAGTNRILPAHQFEIYSLENKTRLNVTRDSNATGYIYWPDTISYKAYSDVIHESGYDLRIVDLETHEEVIRRVYVNPWMHKSSPAFFHDQSEGGLNPSSNQQPVLKIMGENHSVVDKMVPSLDSQLNLILTSNFDFSFLPQVYRRDDPTTGLKASGQDLRPGKYKLTFLVYVTNADRTEITDLVSAAQKIVVVDDHQNFNLNLNLPYEIAQHGLSRSFAVAQVSLLDQTVLKSEPLIFPLRIDSSLGSAPLVERDNWNDSKLKNLAQSLLNVDVEQRFAEYSAHQHQTPNVELQQQFKNAGFIRHANKFGLQAVEVDWQTAVHEGYNLSAKEFEKGLECLEQASWQYDKLPALCLKQKETQKIINNMCARVMNEVGRVALGNLSMPTYDSDQTLMILQIKNKCLENAADFFRIEKQIYVYQKSGETFRNGFSKTVNFYTGMATGYNKGDSLVDERASSYNVGGTALLTLGSIFQLMTLGVPAPSPVITRTKAIKDAIVSFETDSVKSPRIATGSRRYERFKQIFDTELELNEAGLTNAVSYNLDNINFEIHAVEWRKCFAVFPDLSKYRDQIIGVEDSVKDIKKYYCFPVEKGELTLHQNYYVAHPTDGGSTAMIDGGDQRNFGQTLVLKGTRDFQALFQSLKKQMPNYKLNGIARDTRDVWKMVQVNYRQHLLLEDRSMLNSEPPRDFSLYGPAAKPGVLENVLDFFNLGRQNARKNLPDQNDPDLVQFTN